MKGVNERVRNRVRDGCTVRSKGYTEVDGWVRHQKKEMNWVTRH
jgi:hypothetical protein